MTQPTKKKYKDLFRKLEKEIIKDKLVFRCRKEDFEEDCVQCTFWRDFDILRNIVLGGIE